RCCGRVESGTVPQASGTVPDRGSRGCRLDALVVGADLAAEELRFPADTAGAIGELRTDAGGAHRQRQSRVAESAALSLHQQLGFAVSATAQQTPTTAQ